MASTEDSSYSDGSKEKLLLLMAAVADAVARRPSKLMAVSLTVQREMESMVYMVYGRRRAGVVLWCGE